MYVVVMLLMVVVVVVGDYDVVIADDVIGDDYDRDACQ
jgi:Na+/glutamate symporter